MTVLITHLIVEYAKSLPGFSKLNKEDQIILLKVRTIPLLIDYVLFRVPLESFLFIGRHHYCWWRALEWVFWPEFDVYGIWARKDCYLVVTGTLGFAFSGEGLLNWELFMLWAIKEPSWNCVLYQLWFFYLIQRNRSHFIDSSKGF